MATLQIYQYAPEMGIFTFILLIIFFAIMHKLRGKFSNIQFLLPQLHWIFIDSNGVFKRCLCYLRVACIISLIAPFLFFVFWIVIMAMEAHKKTISLNSPIAIALIYGGIFLIVLSKLQSLWAFDRNIGRQVIYLFLGFACLASFQLVTLFIEENKSFFSITAVFFSYNNIMVIFIIFLSGKKLSCSFRKYINETLSSAPSFDNTNTKILSSVREGPIPSKIDICNYYTIDKTFSDSEYIRNGIQEFFADFSNKRKLVTKIILYAVSIGILIIYSIIIYKSTPQYGLGVVTSVAVATTDLLLLLYSRIKQADQMMQHCLISVLFRISFYIFGGNYWVYGYILMFCIFGFLIAWDMAEIKYPFMSKLEIDHFIGRGEKKLTQDVSENPEFLLMLSTVIYAAIITIVAFGKLKGVPVPPLIVDNISIPFYLLAVLSIFAIIMFYCILAFVRSLIRKKLYLISSVHIYAFSRHIDIYWIQLVAAWLSTDLFFIVLFLITSKLSWLVYGIFISTFVTIGFNSLIHYVENDYNLLQNIENANKMRSMFNKIREKNLKQVKSSNFTGLTVINVEQQAIETKPLQNNDQMLGSIYLNREDTIGRKFNIAQRAGETFEDLEDWHANGKGNAFVAFWKGRLMFTDYNIIIGLVMWMALAIGFGFALHKSIAISDRNSWVGFSVAVPFLTIGLSVCAFIKVLIKNEPLKPLNIVSMCSSVFIHIIYIILRMKYATQGIPFRQNPQSFNFVLIYAFVIPMFIELVTFLRKFIQDKYKFNLFSILLAITFSIELICLFFFLWVYSGRKYGIGVLISIAIIIYCTIVIIKYVQNKFYAPLSVKVANLTLYGMGCLTPMIYSWCVSDYDRFIGYTITYQLIASGLTIFSVFKLIMYFSRISYEPILISSYLYPIMKYNSIRNEIVEISPPILFVYLVLAAEVFWSVTCVVYITRAYIGAIVVAYAEIIIVWYILFLITYSTSIYQGVHKVLTKHKNYLSKSWKFAQQQFISSTFESEGDSESATRFIDSYKKFNTSLRKLNESESQYYDNCCDLNKKLRLLRIKYDEEAALLYLFELYTIIVVNNTIARTRRITINFVLSKEALLKERGIIINIRVSLIRDEQNKYIAIQNQVNRLSDMQKLEYNNLLKEYEKEVDEINEIEKKREEEANKVYIENAKHEYTLYIEQKKNQVSTPQECLQKYKEMLSKYSVDNPYVDSDFNERNMLGDKYSSKGPNSIERPSREMRPIIEQKSISFAKQGMLGNCYFVSSLSVLNVKRIKEILINHNEKSTGGYILRFFRYDQPEYVMIDDKFPMVDPSAKQFFFAQSEKENELWPSIIEKGYAKFHCNYTKLESGFMHIALEELTGGEPLLIKLDDSFQSNKNFYWNKLLKWHNQGYMLGAGSPDAGTDRRRSSDNSIIYGHAYSILQIKEYKGYCLLQLRNPNGDVEWSGEWSDNDPIWNDSAKRDLRHTPKENDGIFWMTFDSFIAEYSKLYVCKANDKLEAPIELNGKFEGITAAGMKTGESKIENNPQYAITVNRPCYIYVKMAQMEKNDTDPKLGKLPIYCMIANKNGKRLSSLDKKDVVVSSGRPCNYSTISMETEFGNDYSYPRKFTLFVACSRKGEEGNFHIKVFSDIKLSITPIPLEPHYISED